MKKFVSFLTLLFVSGIGVASAEESTHAEGDPALDGVVDYVVPRYSNIVLGKFALVEVQVAQNGQVEQSKILYSPNKLISRWVGDAAQKWCFEPIATKETRFFTIFFTLNSVTTDAPGGVRSRYENPLTLHLEYVEPTVWFLDRVDGEVPQRECDVHDLPMAVKRLPIHYGLVMYTNSDFRKRKSFWRARKRKFPNSAQAVRMGCIVGSEKQAEQYVCPSCEKARESWIKSHPNKKTDSY